MPSSDRLAAWQSHIERQGRILEECRQLGAEWAELSRSYQAEMRALVGEEKYAAATPSHRALLERLVKCPTLFDGSGEGRRAEEVYRAQLITERHELYRSLGFDHAAAIKLRASYLERSNAVIERQLGASTGFVAGSAAKSPVTPNPWSRHSAPFVDEWGTGGADDTGGVTSGTHAENRWSGAISCRSFSRLIGADDGDHGWTMAMSEIWIWFRMPAAGMVEAYVDLQDVETGMSGNLHDESGCSDGRARQTSRAYLWTSGGTERFQTIRDYSVTTDGSNRSWNIPLTSPGAFIHPHLFSSRSYPAGAWVLCAIGVRDDTSFWVNDMSVNPSSVTSSYFVKDVYLRSTGAP
jgi:hypothetical protein